MPEIGPSEKPGHSKVTFVFQGGPETKAVGLTSAISHRDFTTPQLERDGDSDTWRLTLELPNALRMTYCFWENPLDPDPDLLKKPPEEFQARVQQMLAGQRPDPLNPRSRVGQFGIAEGLLELPDAPAQPWSEPWDGVPQGQMTELTVESTRLGNSRKVRVYTPPGYDPAAGPYPLVVLLDGEGWEPLTEAPRIFDNLIADGAVPPFVAALACNADAMSRMTEYPCNPSFAEFAAEELLPRLRSEFAVAEVPAQVAIGGVSYGGLAAAWIGLRHPDSYGKVISMSASMWWAPEDDADGHEYLTRLYAAAPRLPQRIYADVGTLEDSGPQPVDHRSANRHFRDVLAARGCEHRYVENVGGHQFVIWQGSLPEAIRYVFGS